MTPKLKEAFDFLHKLEAGNIPAMELHYLRLHVLEFETHVTTVYAQRCGINLLAKAREALTLLEQYAMKIFPPDSGSFRQIFVARFTAGYEDVLQEVQLASGTNGNEKVAPGVYWVSYDQDSWGSHVERLTNKILSGWEMDRVVKFINGADRVLAGKLWTGAFLHSYVEDGVGRLTATDSPGCVVPMPQR